VAALGEGPLPGPCRQRGERAAATSCTAAVRALRWRWQRAPASDSAARAAAMQSLQRQLLLLLPPLLCASGGNLQPAADDVPSASAISTEPAIDTMISRAEAALLPSESGQAQAAERWAASLNASGLWPDCSSGGGSSSSSSSSACAGDGAACALQRDGEGEEDCIDYSDCINDEDCEDNWLAAEHIYVRTLAMAQVLRSGNSSSNSTFLAAKTALALQGWLDLNRTITNWWWPDIGQSIPLGQVLLLLRDNPALDPLLRARGLELLRHPGHKWDSAHESEICLHRVDGANALWECWAFVYYGLLQRNSSLLRETFDHIHSQIRIDGGSDSGATIGIKPDGSFWHHGAQLQETHYGQDFATASMFFAKISDGIDGYELPADSYAALAKLVLDGQMWASVFDSHSWTAESLSRAITYPNGSRCWPQVPGAWSKQGSGDNCFHARELRGVGGERGHEFDNFAELLDGAGGSGRELVGHRTFWLSDWAVHREVVGGRMWVSTAKGFDGIPHYDGKGRGLLSGECVNDAGKQSLYLSNGANFNYYSAGAQYLKPNSDGGIFPLWDWTRVPGTTVEGPPFPALSCSTENDGRAGTSHFVGGADAPSGAGVFAFNFTPGVRHQESLRFRKVFAWPKDGTMISCVDGLDAEELNISTTLEQSWAAAPTDVDRGIGLLANSSTLGRSFSNGGLTYKLLKPSSSTSVGPLLHASVQTRMGNWTTIAQEYGMYPQSHGDVFTLRFTHGSQRQSICYSVSPGEQARPTAAHKVLQTSDATVVTSDNATIAIAAFWRSGVINVTFSVELGLAEQTMNLVSSAPCVVIVEYLSAQGAARDGKFQLSAADPSRSLHQRGGLTLALGNCTWRVPLPVGSLAGSTIVKSDVCVAANTSGV
jgi:hypothetical protein